MITFNGLAMEKDRILFVELNIQKNKHTDSFYKTHTSSVAEIE